MHSPKRQLVHIEPYDGTSETPDRWRSQPDTKRIDARLLVRSERPTLVGVHLGGRPPFRTLPSTKPTGSSPPPRGMGPSPERARLLASTLRRSYVAELVKDPPAPDLDTEIRALYARLHRLARDAGQDPDKEKQYQRTLASLRKLQQAEAAQLNKEKDARLHLRPGEGRAALRRAKEMIAQYAYLADSDEPADNTDS